MKQLRRLGISVGAAGMVMAGMSFAQAPATNGPSGPAAEVQRSYAALKKNILKAAEIDKAYAALTDANLTEMLPLGPNKRSRLGLMWGNVSHDNEQYATLALYMRLKGLVPPSSEK